MNRLFSLKSITKPEKLHGLIFDSFFFLSHLLFPVGILAITQNFSDTEIAILLSLAILTQFLGAGLKKRFLAQRLEPGSNGMAGVADSFMKVLIFLHFLLFTISIVMALLLFGIYHGGGTDTVVENDIWILVALVFSGLITATVYRAGQGKENESQDQARNWWLEYVADGLLWVSVSVLTRLYWGMALELIEPAQGIGLTGRSIVLLIAMSFMFVIFYLPGRYLFLVEDYKSPLTWAQVWLAMIPVYASIIFG